MDWLDYVLQEDRRDFLKFEKIIAKKELKAFDEAETYREKESARARVVAKRLVALSQWIDVYEIKGSIKC